MRAFLLFFLASFVLAAPHGAAAQARPAQARRPRPDAARYAAPLPASETALWITDIHLNPYSVPGLVPRLERAPLRRWRRLWLAALRRHAAVGHRHPYGRYGQDSNARLFDSALDAMRQADPHPAFIVVTGDLLAHGFHRHFLVASPRHAAADYQAFVQRMFRYVVLRLRAAFPYTPMLPALGNNDSDCGDYQTRPGAPFMTAAAAAWAGVLPGGARTARQFAAAGYYSVLLPAPGAAPPLRAIVLNDVLWSSYYRNRCGSPLDARAGNEEMRWLDATLYAAALRHERVWVAAHIPPGADVFTTLRHASNLCAAPPVLFLASRYNRRLTALLAQYPGLVRLGLFGHTHQDEFRFDAGVPLKIAPALSPIFGNNPAFTLLRLAGGRALDYRVYRLDLAAAHPSWREEYDFDQAYRASALAALAALPARLRAAPAARRRFQRFYNVGSLAPNFSRLAWPDFACGIARLTPAAFRRCVCPAKK